MMPLNGKKIVSIAANLPGPKTCQLLKSWGAEITKIEPPAGDQLQHYYPKWYENLNAGQNIYKIDLKDPKGRKDFDTLLSKSDLLITSGLASSLTKLDLEWSTLHRKFQSLSLLQIFSYESEDQPGHDLNFQMNHNLVHPPDMPRTLSVDLMGGERAASLALIMLLGSEGPRCEKVYLNQVAEELSSPIEFGATGDKGLLSGDSPLYGFYECCNGWVAVCILEKHYVKIVQQELKVEKFTRADLVQYFSQQTVENVLKWAKEKALPISGSTRKP
jgi:alpha-methylacyl-CoA racemase